MWLLCTILINKAFIRILLQYSIRWLIEITILVTQKNGYTSVHNHNSANRSRKSISCRKWSFAQRHSICHGAFFVSPANAYTLHSFARRWCKKLYEDYPGYLIPQGFFYIFGFFRHKHSCLLSLTSSCISTLCLPFQSSQLVFNRIKFYSNNI